MMPAPPAEVTAEFTIHPFTEGRMERHVEAGVEAARASGLAVEVGPFGTGLSGPRSEVVTTLSAVMHAAIDAGARTIQIKIEVPSEAR
jgi:uncharacterized protein YqgV (UPF0045/DUF77 family)